MIPPFIINLLGFPTQVTNLSYFLVCTVSINLMKIVTTLQLAIFNWSWHCLELCGTALQSSDAFLLVFGAFIVYARTPIFNSVVEALIPKRLETGRCTLFML
jgi:hypothetical protein